MNRTRLAILSLTLVLLLALTPLTAWAAGPTGTPATVQVKTQSITLVFDGQELKLPEGQFSFIHQGRTYVPIRYLSYALLKQVGWDGEKNQVSVSEPSEEELVELKKQLQLAGSGKKASEQQSIKLKVKEATLVFNGEEKALPEGQSLFIYNGSSYVPVRFLAESVGTEIGWDPTTKTVSGESEAYRAEHGSGHGSSETEEEGAETDQEAGAGAGAGTGTGAGAGGSGGGTGGGPAAKPTYEQITADAQASLEALRSSCKTTLMDIALEYIGADEADKASIAAEIQQEIDNCTVKFEAILSDTSAKLTAGGYSTAIIEEYRAAFEAELEAGKKIAEGLA